jgi:hypothetical protein
MGQKINSIGFRLGSRRAWSFVCATDYANISSTFLTNLETYHKISKTLERFGVLTNSLVIKKAAKCQQVFGRVINTTKLVPNWKVSPVSRQEDHSGKKRFVDNFSHVSTEMSLNLTPFSQSKIQQLLQRLSVYTEKKIYGNRQHTQKAKDRENLLFQLELLFRAAIIDEPKFNSSTILNDGRLSNKKSISLLSQNIVTRSLIPSLNAQILSAYIKRQMSFSQKFKDSDFRSGLKVGITQLAIFLFRRFSNITPIQGLRIVCSGRWSKTRSGRKQRLVYTRGSLKRLAVSALLDYGMSTVTTKFGACSIKVWILYAPTDSLPKLNLKS